MKTVKRIATILFAVIITATFLVGCNFNVKFNGCTGSSTDDDTRLPEQQEVLTSEYTFFMEKLENTFYLPKISGYVIRESVPDKMSVVCDGNEFPLEITSLKFVNGMYKMSFSQNVEIYRGLKKDEDLHIAVMIYTEEEKTMLKKDAFFVVDENYEPLAIADAETYETIFVLDKSSNWTNRY